MLTIDTILREQRDSTDLFDMQAQVSNYKPNG